MCGIVGIFGHHDLLRKIEIAHRAVTNRGSNGGGLAILEKNKPHLSIIKDYDLDTVYQSEDVKNADALAAMGHTRWPTAGPNNKENLQPHFTQDPEGKICLLSNGDVVNMDEQVAFLTKEGIRIISGNDAEMICAAIYWQIKKRGKENIHISISKAMEHIKGSYSALFMADWDRALYAFRDPHGIRPMLLGMIDDRYIVCSESWQLEKTNARFIRQIKPGEIVRISDDGLTSFQGQKEAKRHFCSIEKIYFQHPNSRYFFEDGTEISNVELRFQLGEILATEHPVKNADLVIGVPKSGRPAASGYAQKLRQTLGREISCVNEALIAEASRTFIEKDALTRKKRAELKYWFNNMVRGKVIVLIDDSLIRGLTSLVITQKAFAAGAREVHWRISSPPYVNHCYYGVDTKDSYALVARDKSKPELLRAIGSPTSLEYLSIESLKKVLEHNGLGHCYACVNGDYPIVNGIA